MRRETRIVTIFLLALFLLGFSAGFAWGWHDSPTTEEVVRTALKEYGILDGTSLRAMMNEARYSPDLANAFAEKYPAYTYLFDNSFVAYIEN